MQFIKTLLITAITVVCVPAAMFAQEQDKAPYDGSWEALQKMPVPAWFDDGKIGIFIPVSYTHLTLPTIYSV